VAAALFKDAAYIEAVNAIGGHNGVDINGVLGVEGIIVTPRIGGKLFNQLADIVRLEVSGKLITDLFFNAVAKVPSLGAVYDLTGMGVVAHFLGSGTPLGWALYAAASAGLGTVINHLLPEPKINDFGHVDANRNEAREWETFTIASHPNGSISLLSHMGYLCAEQGGGDGVFANRPAVGDWEHWQLINNRDGSFSLRTANGHYLTAEGGGGRECNANRTAIGPWEKFHLVPLETGRMALKASNGQFVSVQKRTS
jgi:hypothetical protein